MIHQKILFTENECKEIIRIYKKNNKLWIGKDRNYQSNDIEYSKETEWIFDRLKIFFENTIKLKIIKNKEIIHFHKYSKEDWFGKHNDIKEKRLYAVGVLLNDEFSGGNFNFTDINITLDKHIGNTYVFNVELNHEIEKITQGERYSLLWFLDYNNIKTKTLNLI